jgi:hypothetical protein
MVMIVLLLNKAHKSILVTVALRSGIKVFWCSNFLKMLPAGSETPLRNVKAHGEEGEKTR